MENSKVVIAPVPYDGTSTWGKGADKGPEAVIAASANMELYDIECDCEVYRQGIYTDGSIEENSSPEKMVEKVREKVREHINNGKLTVVIGGEHSVSIGAVQAYGEKYKDLSVLQLDAHSDLRPSYLGSKYNHACAMARIKEICPAVQVGIRSMDVGEREFIDKDRVFFAEEMRNQKDWQEKALEKLSSDVYVTIDLDVFDPSVVPSTGTPEPGGLGWYEVLDFLKKVSEKRNIVGFDVVELCPNETEKSSDFLASKLIYKLLSYKFCAKY